MSAQQDSFQIAVTVQALAARHEVMSIALQEALQLLSGEQATRFSRNLRARVGALTSPALAVAIPEVDEAVAGELSALLAALSR